MIRVDKETTKLRVVYDASAKAQSTTPSLNDCLYAGPPLSSLIYDILLTFRVHKVALSGDREGLSEHFSSFLWVDDTGSKHPNLQVYRFARVAFGISLRPFLLNATIRHHLTSIDLPREFVECVLKFLYVDDIVGGGELNNMKESLP